MATGQARVIVVDDDPIMRSLISAQLTSEQTQVIEAGDGAMAWDFLRREACDLAIVDLDMPNLDGFDLIRCLRAHPKTQHLAIIVVTSREDGSSMRRALDVGATSFLTKPVLWSTFTPHVMNLLHLSHSTSLAEARICDGEQVAEVRDEIVSCSSRALESELAGIRHSLQRLVDAQKVIAGGPRSEVLDGAVRQLEAAHRTLAEMVRDYECAGSGNAARRDAAMQTRAC